MSKYGDDFFPRKMGKRKKNREGAQNTLLVFLFETFNIRFVVVLLFNTFFDQGGIFYTLLILYNVYISSK